MKFKICTRCKKTRVLSKFTKQKECKDGVRSICKHCDKEWRANYYLNNKEKIKKSVSQWQKENRVLVYARKKSYYKKHPIKRKQYQRLCNLKYKFGMTVNDYNKILKNQNYTCAICHKKESKQKHLSVDHNHKTGKVRGLLCSNCNNTLGLLYEDIKILKSMITYLRKDRGKK